MSDSELKEEKKKKKKKKEKVQEPEKPQKLSKQEKRALKRAAEGLEDPKKGIEFDEKDADGYTGTMVCPDPEFDPENNNCRFYENPYPNQGDLLLVKVKTVAEMGAYVELLEYNRIEGMILLSELSRRRIRSINKLIRVGKTEAVSVLRVDTEKGYIDLSKRRVSAEDVKKCEEKYKKSKKVHSILTNVSQVCQVPLFKLYEQVGWPIYKAVPTGEGETAPHAYDTLKLLVDNPELLDKYDLHPHVRKALLRHVKLRMTPKAVKIRADVEINCFHPMGIEAIKKALKAALAEGQPEMKISAKLVAPPLFVMVLTTKEEEEGVKVLERAVEKCRESITADGGILNVKQAPRTVTDKDDKILKEVMEKLELENQEVAGDDD